MIAAVLGGFLPSGRFACSDVQQTVPAVASVSSACQERTDGDAFAAVLEVLSEYDSRPNVSLMKFGKAAMVMGRTVGKAGGAWTRKVAKAFRHVSTVHMLEYAEASASVRDEIEAKVLGALSRDSLVYDHRIGGEVFEEAFGTVSPDGRHVSDVVIVLYGQSVVCLSGTVLSSDVERIVRRLARQL